jgi:hypothetical protein
MKMTTRSSFILLILLLGLFRPASGQEQPLKDYADKHKDRKLCFYPSTLRMINIGKNPDFNELVSGIEKLLVYTLDSAAKADQSYTEIIPTYKDLGFEEYASAYGGETNFFLYGKEAEKDNQFVGVFRNGEELMAFYMHGNIGWQSIPKLMMSFREDEIINILNLNEEKFENDPDNP